MPLGWAIAALSLPPIVDAGGLSAGLAALGIGCLAGAAVGVLLLRDPPRFADADLDPGRPLSDRRLWRLSAGSTFYVGVQIALTSFVVVYLHDERGFSVAEAAAVLAVISILGGALRILLGRLSDRLATRVVPLRAVGVVLAAAVGLTAALSHAPNAVLVPVLIAAGAISCALERPVVHRRRGARRPRQGRRRARLPADGARRRQRRRPAAVRLARLRHLLDGRIRGARGAAATRRLVAWPAGARGDRVTGPGGRAGARLLQVGLPRCQAP